jgi:hypothetical protein
MHKIKLINNEIINNYIKEKKAKCQPKWKWTTGADAIRG